MTMHSTIGSTSNTFTLVLKLTVLATLALLFSPLFGEGAAFGNEEAIQLVATVAIPGKPLKSFDISWVDPHSQIYYLADRSNAGVDIVDTKTNTFLGRIGGFVGVDPRGNDHSGPDGVVSDGDRLYAGDGDSTVKVIDLDTRTIINVVSTGGTARADEMAIGDNGRVLLVVNNADEPAFMTLISTKPGNPILAGNITVPGATNGIEQPVWDARTKRFYISVPALNGSATDGGVAVVDPKTKAVEKVYPVAGCQPNGIALGPHQHLLLGCSVGTTIISAKDGSIVAQISQVGGSDEVWFNPGEDLYYVAANHNPGGPVLGVIDAETNHWLQNVQTFGNAHSVAANPRNNRVFVPFTAVTPSPCPNGCVGVYAEPEEDEGHHTRH